MWEEWVSTDRSLRSQVISNLRTNRVIPCCLDMGILNRSFSIKQPIAPGEIRFTI